MNVGDGAARAGVLALPRRHRYIVLGRDRVKHRGGRIAREHLLLFLSAAARQTNEQQQEQQQKQTAQTNTDANPHAAV